MPPLLEARDLSRHFAVRAGLLRRRVGEVRAVDGVDLELWPGESFALVGESGSGKTTLGRTLLRLVEPSSGRVIFDGADITSLGQRELRHRRREFQMVFQDPYGSLNPRMAVGRVLREPLVIHRLGDEGERRRRVAELLELVGLPASCIGRYPHELSGGQRQRVGIARALATRPRLLIADEPVSALDVSIQAQVVNLLGRLQSELALTLVFIGHDLSVVEQLADRVAVMYLGQIVEEASTGKLFARPLHPYSVTLLSAIPRPEPGRLRHRLVPAGEPPDPTAPPPGCRFHPRCPIAAARCLVEAPTLREVLPGQRVACHFPGELAKP